MTPLVGISEVAKLLAVSVITVRRKVSSGELPCIRLTNTTRKGKNGRPVECSTLRFDLRDVEKFVQQHRS